MLNELYKTELKAFLSLLHLAGLYSNNWLNLQYLGATDGTGIELFRPKLSLWRFRFINNCNWFDDKITCLECLKVNKLAAVRVIFSAFVENCKVCYSMG